MASVTVRVEMPPPGERAKPTSIPRKMRRVMRDAQMIIVDKAKELVSSRRVRRSIRAEPISIVGNSIVGAISAGGAEAPFAGAIEFGSGVYSENPDGIRAPIVIVPKNAKALAWPGAGMGARGGKFRRQTGAIRTPILRSLVKSRTSSQSYNFAKKVVQQGQLPRPFLRRAIEETQDEVSELIVTVLSEPQGVGD